MQLSPQSHAIVDRLCGGSVISSGSTTIGPLSEAQTVLLDIFAHRYDRLAAATGEQQARLLRTLYNDAWRVKRPPTLAVDVTDPGPSGATRAAESASVHSSPPAGWLLHSIECESVRGVAPPGVPWEFSFDDKSCLIYGPNGSGKTSMLGCITWVLAGQVITDADSPEAEATLYKQSGSDKKGAALCTWPVIVTLPDGDPLGGAASCSATVLLHSPDGSQSLFLRRMHTSQLESSSDGVSWTNVDDLSTFGVRPLDLQLSLLAPSVFGKLAIDSAEDTREILSLMLGLDALDELGALASTAAGNRTKLATAERKAVDSAIGTLSTAIDALKEQLMEGSAERRLLEELTAKAKPSLEDIEVVGKKCKVKLADQESRLAAIIGVASEGAAPPPGLADRLTSAVVQLEKGIRDNFPSLFELRPELVLAPGEPGDREAKLATLEDKLHSFLASAAERIVRRLRWWRRERVEGARSSLMLRAAKLYDPVAGTCPVCERSIEGLATQHQLETLRSFDEELVGDVETFFRSLRDELFSHVPELVVQLGEKSPQDRVQDDWTRLKNVVLGPQLTPLARSTDAAIKAVVESIGFALPGPIQLLPANADTEFVRASDALKRDVESARRALSMLRWSLAGIPKLEAVLDTAVTSATIASTAPSSPALPSLLELLAKGKEAAAVARPLTTVIKGLRNAYDSRKTLQDNETALSVLDEIADALEPIKFLTKYAASEVESVFEKIRSQTVANWKLLYPESGSGLTPFSLSMGKGKDRSVEALLSKKNYVVQGQHFANAGLQRAIALSFYFALLDHHPGGLGFMVLDDPILSLDEDHRESWSRHLLHPAMERLQVVVGTHQRQYLNDCKHHFGAGRVVELNPRAFTDRITWRPGDRIARADVELKGAWTNAPTEMRKWREEVLATLDSYSPQRIFNAANLTGSLDSYERLSAPSPLAGKQQRTIVATFRHPEVSKVLDPGSHHMTEADVTLPMAKECLRRLKELEKTVQNEFKRLESERIRALRSGTIAASAIDFPPLATESKWDEPIPLRVFGRAAAKSSGCVVDTTDDDEVVNVAPGSAVLVTATTLDPIAKFGQLVLLASPEERVEDGDLVAVSTTSGQRMLRRIWSDGMRWILQGINPVVPVPCVVIAKAEAAFRKIVGVVFAHPGLLPVAGSNEWMPIDFPVITTLMKHKAITVVGDSMEPIAKNGQRVLVGAKHEGDASHLKGNLAVVETDEASVGNVIKRVFPGKKDWLLESVNPIDPHDPLLVPFSSIRAIWPLRGVVFHAS